jgi:hypothetical protein
MLDCLLACLIDGIDVSNLGGFGLGLIEVRHLLTDAGLFLGAAIGHIPMVRVEMPVGVEYGISTRLHNGR